jgi:hypothetical protein
LGFSCQDLFRQRLGKHIEQLLTFVSRWSSPLRIALAKAQGRKFEEALYSVVADPRHDTVVLF